MKNTNKISDKWNVLCSLLAFKWLIYLKMWRHRIRFLADIPECWVFFVFCFTHHIEWFIPVNANTQLIYFHANDISLKNEMSEHHKNSTFTKCDQLNWLCFFPQIKLNVWWDWDAALCRDYLQHSKYHLSGGAESSWHLFERHKLYTHRL